MKKTSSKKNQKNSTKNTPAKKTGHQLPGSAHVPVKDVDKIRTNYKAQLPEGLTPATTEDMKQIINSIPLNHVVRTKAIVHKLMTLTDPKHFGYKGVNGTTEFVSSVKPISKDPVYQYHLHQVWSFLYQQQKTKTPVLKKIEKGIVQRVS